MATSIKPVPEGASVVIPRLVCQDVGAAIDFCTHTFGAVERVRRPGPDGVVAHALLMIGPAMVMIEAEWPTLPSRAPTPDGSSPVVLYIYVEDVDATVARAIAGGAQVLFPVQNQFWGDRIAWIMDPSGHVWTVASRIEETTSAERDQRWASLRESEAEKE
jgi:PhnB protein